MQHYRLNPLWTPAVFLVAFLFYVLTASTVLYPGLSTEFLAPLMFPEQLPLALAEPLDQVIYHTVIQWGGAAHAMTLTTCASAFFGAFIITCLFRAAVAGVRIMCLDHATLPDSTRLQAQSEDNSTALLVGLGVALMGLVALPLWSMATRPLPGICTTLLAMGTITLALGVRWRCALMYFYEEKPSWKTKLFIFCVFALATLSFFLSPTLLPVSIFGIALAGWIMVKQELDGRVGYIYVALAGIVTGVLLSFCVMALWQSAFLPEGEGDTAMLWVAQAKGLIPALFSLFFTFDGVCQLALCGAAIALYIGCFPYAYLSFSRPLIGQVALLTLLALTFIQWPGEFWDTLSEPSTLATCGYLLLLLTVGLLIGSWVRNWYDGHSRLNAVRLNTIAAVIMFVPILFVLIGAGIFHASRAAGSASQGELEEMWAQLDRAIPQSKTVWWKPEPQLYGILLNRAIKGQPIQPLTSFEKDLSRLTIQGKSFEAFCAEDPVFAALKPYGMSALMAYFFYVAADEIHVGAFPKAEIVALDEMAEALARSSFTETPVGRETLRTLRAQIARAYMQRAQHLPHAEAAGLLRRAYALDPENVSAIVSIGELPQAAGMAISEKERFVATDLIEHDDLLRDPTPESAYEVEALYGPVRAQRFRAALRLHRLLHVDREMMLARLCDNYRQGPASLSLRERDFAVLHLPEAEAAQLLLNGNPTASEVAIYLCANPWTTEAAHQIWEKYREALFSEEKGLVFLRQRMKDGTQRQILDRAHTFFQDTKDFSFALFYVNRLIEQGDLQEAEEFASSFKVQEYLGDRPCLAEYLRLQVAKALIAKDAAAAATTLQTWLRNMPEQMALWSLHLTNPALQAQPDRLAAEATRCLASYPFHPVAAKCMADQLRRTGGEALARQYEEAINAARLDALNDEDGYAHR